jgi:hypothetical protein
VADVTLTILIMQGLSDSKPRSRAGLLEQVGRLSTPRSSHPAPPMAEGLPRERSSGEGLPNRGRQRNVRSWSLHSNPLRPPRSAEGSRPASVVRLLEALPSSAKGGHNIRRVCYRWVTRQEKVTDRWRARPAAVSEPVSLVNFPDQREFTGNITKPYLQTPWSPGDRRSFA